MSSHNTNKDIFIMLLNALGNSIDATVKYGIMHQIMLQSVEAQKEHEKLVDDVANEVLSRLSATVDMTEVFQKLDELNDRINRLGL